MQSIRHFLRRSDMFFEKIEQSILVSLVLIMVGLAFIQICLRILFHFGIIWGDVALRHLVLWVGLFGATVATRESRHITIDILPRLLHGKAKNLLSIFIDFFSALICLLLTHGSLKFVRDEFLANTTSFLEIPGWILGIIFPLAFSIITLHFCLNGFAKILSFEESV
ncbi:MAG: TRAP transporter small permease subunit [Proteobacteria bacterium]|nr:TRAP transporter small permease subunit [Pseudomonadota bacterium]